MVDGKTSWTSAEKSFGGRSHVAGTVPQAASGRPKIAEAVPIRTSRVSGPRRQKLAMSV